MVRFQKAERRKSKLRLGMAGPAGSGKTYSALLIAFGLMADPSHNGRGKVYPVGKSNRVGMIDTERGSGDLYADLGDYDVCPITPPFEPEKYTAAIKAGEEAGYGVIIIDSLSHAWSGEGGLLDLQGHLADRSGNSWAAWRKVTPKHNQLVEAMLQSRCHIIATMRSKTEYAQATENGKTVVKKLGMSPIQRDGMEYEFTLFLDLDIEHVAAASKDRTSLFDGKFFTPSMDTGKTLIQWLDKGAERKEPHDEQQDPKPKFQNRKPKEAGNGARILLAKINTYRLREDAYEAYCNNKYGIKSMDQLTSAQREEQIKILNSLASPERLKEFKQILSQTRPGGEKNRSGSEQAGAFPVQDTKPAQAAVNFF